MQKILRVTEGDLTRIVRRIIKESTPLDAERFSLGDVETGMCGTSGKWEVDRNRLVLLDCKIDDGKRESFTVDAHIVSCDEQQGLERERRTESRIVRRRIKKY